MDYKYHCQHQAESFANSIIPVPEKYPLREGLPSDFPVHFARLCELAKDIYMDMAKQPEAYGLMLVDINTNDHNLARDGYRTIHRFAETIYRLSICGELKNHQLIIPVEIFNKAIKKSECGISSSVAKYELIFSHLIDFGFVISDFEGKPFNKKIESFTVEYPDYPEMIDTIKTYCECWDSLKNNRSEIKYSPNNIHHRFYRFDYKLTSDITAIPMKQWVNDDAYYNGFPPALKIFSLAFFDASLKYKGLKFDGEYYYKSKRIAHITHVDYSALGKPDFKLSLKLSEPDKYINTINIMSDSIKQIFSKNYCNHCTFQGATNEYCKFRLKWTYGNQPYEGCAYQCFNFNDFDLARVPDYWRLLESEYGLKKFND